jgi:hypothetical protein
MNLFEIMRGAGGGEAFAQLARQFGLSEDQIAKAVQAFMPAFSAGLKRSTADPFGFAEFMRKLAVPDFTRAYQQPDWAFGAGRGQGEDALAFMFGSPEMGRAVASQAAAFTGLAQEKMNELMPAVAAMTFGGLAKQATASNPFLDAMLKQFRAGETETSRAEKGPLDRYEDEQSARGGGAGAADLARTQGEMMQAGMAAFQTGTAMWQQAMAEMMKSAGAAAGTADGKEAGPTPSGRDLFGDMFEPGLRLGEAYQREMEAIFARLRPEAKGS